MNSFFRCLIKSAVFLGLWMMVFVNTGATFEPIPAELTANTNLREKPDIHGKIIVLINKNDQIFIHDENQKWANVSYEKNGRRINGWVSTKYLLKTATDPKGPQTENLEKKPVHQASQSFPDTAPTDAPSPPERQPETARKERTIVSEPLSPSDKTEVSKATIPLSGDDVSAFFKNKAGMHLQAEDSSLESGQVSTYGLIGFIIRFLFKFSLVIVSCVALIFSYSALQIAKSSNRLMP